IMKDFYSYFDEFTRVEGQNKAWSHATYQKFKTLKVHLQNFEKSESIKMEFQKINKEFYQKIFDYFVKKGHRNSSIKKTFMNINWFLGWCIENKNITIKDFKKFTIKESKSAAGNPLNIVFLKPEEFLMMFEANIPDLRLSRIKDIFCFMCACGLRYSDMAALRREDVTADSIKITTQKTADALEIPLNHFSKSILQKYDNSLPKISNVRLNLYLKELAKYLELNRRLTKVYIKAGTTVKEEAELWQVLTSHCARKTFISLSVFLNMNPEIIMRFSGHHSHKMMEVYTGITDKQKQAQMALFTAENIRDKIAN
ncbi:MAG: tyrosine-type recombinase/integrase, partial [Paludibacter sp.]